MREGSRQDGFARAGEAVKRRAGHPRQTTTVRRQPRGARQRQQGVAFDVSIAQPFDLERPAGVRLRGGANAIGLPASDVGLDEVNEVFGAGEPSGIWSPSTPVISPRNVRSFSSQSSSAARLRKMRRGLSGQRPGGIRRSCSRRIASRTRRCRDRPTPAPRDTCSGCSGARAPASIS